VRYRGLGLGLDKKLGWMLQMFALDVHGWARKAIWEYLCMDCVCNENDLIEVNQPDQMKSSDSVVSG